MSSPLRPIMFVGTCSDAGKSVLNAAFCRIFKQDGYAPAPFKAQNMSLNSFSTPKISDTRGQTKNVWPLRNFSLYIASFIITLSKGITKVRAASLSTGGVAIILNCLTPVKDICNVLGIGVAIGGDLFESILKRRAGVSDSGRMIPGHGGMLDRIDSYIFMAPYILLAFWIIALC